MTATFRDPAYLLGLGLLGVVILLSLTVARPALDAATGPGRGSPFASVYTPTAGMTATLAQQLLDVQRSRDLKSAAALLETYRERFGAYPSSGDTFTTFCSRSFDPGCQLRTIANDVPAEDALYPYWYRSDGRTFTLFAQTDTAISGEVCPKELPPLLVDVPVLCVSGARGGD